MNTDRRLTVLSAIIEDYVATSEPVGSKSLLDRHALGVSAATIRNDMAVLEEQGLIAAPHTSAGRIPTDAGYRLFVDRLAQTRSLSSAQKNAIAGFLEGAVDLDDVVERTTRLLASLTRQVAAMQYPSLTRSRVQHIELLPLGVERVMLVLILDSGRVEQRRIDLPEDIDHTWNAENLSHLRDRINAASVGCLLPEAAVALRAHFEENIGPEHTLVEVLLRVLNEALVEESEERVLLVGTGNLARFGTDFPLSVGPVLEALEEHMVLLRLFGSLAEGAPAGAVGVSIGQENPHEGLASTSVVGTGYGVGTDTLGGLAVIGPTRMDYPGTMAAVRAVANYVSRMLGS
ncbi:heat-inducible transcriptional repressor HrcA [Dermatophilus congolensis]|uniref:heat-inducible transcriptional repressor HrcA n=1 Tax=Dermatophilus congolensis TaxID=1863 RepID=UPI001AAEEEF0|nr:heat-inducible transcriptional repressor HrcA [Dermatophilus congolensis]MBO3142674.1 heat-inducible transcriptional repressor HrcA [Dermatophilus congolensis]MBO3151666.1 heat-inducible transcriptional repressor HrcA [Dermatophilus congolensis]MBO3161334.1 heat-inducible transcriptional repressor HrcA [Dermatophilus congolensis]MBO3162947.1 heat-inducible transcriptional repressor HrcA [Dermatophilus congolensis]MBO3176499.1 heat-inducible transcriptional repressor HrcA [Dermatophilus cong